MTRLTSQISTASSAFQKNRAEMLALLDGVRAAESKVLARSDSRRAQFAKRSQLHPRDRVALLLDKGSPFLELSTLAGYGMHDDDGDQSASGGASITGLGVVQGTRCIVIAHDSAIKGGAITPMGMRKQLRAQTIALENKLPVVYLVESAGGSMALQADTFVEAGAMFRNQARLSAAGIPQVSVVHGSSTAGGAYLPGLSDYLIMVEGRAKLFLAGPPLLKAATGEVATDEELGGARMHASISGVADYIAPNDESAIELAREVVRNLGWPNVSDPRSYEEPLFDADELAGVVPVDFRKAYDVREVVARLVDGSRFLEFKSNYGAATVCGQAHIMGMPLAIIGNNGPIDADGASKAAQFIQLMCQIGTPIVYCQNITGYMVGIHAERKGIVKHGAKLEQAEAQLIRQFNEESTALFATAKLWDDGIVDPRDSRRVLGLCLSVCQAAQEIKINSNTFGVARL